MNDLKKIPAWAVTMILTLVGVLFTMAVGLSTYIFTDLIGKVSELDRSNRAMGQELREISYRISDLTKKLEEKRGK